MAAWRPNRPQTPSRPPANAPRRPDVKPMLDANHPDSPIGERDRGRSVGPKDNHGNACRCSFQDHKVVFPVAQHAAEWGRRRSAGQPPKVARLCKTGPQFRSGKFARRGVAREAIGRPRCKPNSRHSCFPNHPHSSVPGQDDAAESARLPTPQTWFPLAPPDPVAPSPSHGDALPTRDRPPRRWPLRAIAICESIAPIDDPRPARQRSRQRPDRGRPLHKRPPHEEPLHRGVIHRGAIHRGPTCSSATPRI